MTAGFYVSYVALWVLMIFQTFVLLGLVRKVYRSTELEPHRIAEEDGLPLGSAAPAFAAVDLHGDPVDSTSLAGHQTALLFVSPLCTTCAVTLDELEVLQRKTRGNVIVFCRAGRDDCAQLAEHYGLSLPVVVDEDLRLSELFGVSVPPTAVLVDSHGRILTYGHPMSPAEFERLLADSTASTKGGDGHGRDELVVEHSERA